MARRPSWRLAAVVLAGLLGLTVVAALQDDPDEEEPAPADPSPPEAAEDFLDAWARSRAATYRTVADFTRTSSSTGAELQRRIVIAQRPPDRLRIDESGAAGIVDGRRILCSFRDEELVCNDAEAEVTLEEQAAEQLATLRGYVTGDDPLYDVTADPDTEDGDCFDLGLAHRIVAPPLGVTSRYCFDEDTGAPTHTVVEAVEATDDIRTIQLDTVVTDAQLDPATALG
jgi:hypothetical protein